VSDVTDLLQRLIRVDTTNPPGNETAAAELLRGYLEPAGVECELIARVPERANFIARLRGGDGPTLALLSHTDVVFADAQEWERAPFGGELVDGEVWGRGALDMKGQVAASAVAIASLAREGVRPPGDVIFIAAADEEVGAGFGLSWLCEQHPDAVRADFSVNEGAGDRLDVRGRGVWLCATAEKMTAPFTLRVHGRSGHASMPGIADNALLKAAPLIERLGAYVPEPRLEPEVAALLRAVAGDVPADPRELLDFARDIDSLLGALVEPLLALTFAPTMIEASHKRNVIPAVCEVEVDSRLLPGQTVAEQQEIARTALGPGEYELVLGEHQGGTRSALDTTLWDSIAAFVAVEDPEGVVAPVCVPGFTDSHWLRDAFGTVAYGFFPARTMPVEQAALLIHSANERVPVEDLELGVRFLRHVVQTYAG
jgi:Acetylornithine deacetylase/Succinyl-diaminopimelate desuccinylase and related deacylases